jgi:hypothetical protein
VATSKEYRQYADECFGWAKSAKSDSAREIFLQMAETWLEAAILAVNEPNAHSVPPQHR